MARPRAACSGPTIGMLFSAWQAVTHAPHPVHLSRSTAIPHLCAMSAVAGKLEVRSTKLEVRKTDNQRHGVDPRLLLCFAAHSSIFHVPPSTLCLLPYF